jgi:hypothetical protein
MSDEAAESVESKRINEIMTLKREVFEVKDELDRAEMVGRAPGKAPELYQRKVRDYVISLEPVLNPAGEDPSPYWDRVDIGAFELPNGEQKEVTGLRQFLQLPTSFAVEMTKRTQESYRHMPETKTVTEEVRPPRRVAENAFRAASEAFYDLGFGIEEPAEQTSEFRKIDDVKKATEILDFLRQLDDDGLREIKQLIEQDDEMLSQPDPQVNGHHE